MIRGLISVAVLFTLIMLSCGKAGIENTNPKSEILGNDLTGNDFYSQFINELKKPTGNELKLNIEYHHCFGYNTMTVDIKRAQEHQLEARIKYGSELGEVYIDSLVTINSAELISELRKIQNRETIVQIAGHWEQGKLTFNNRSVVYKDSQPTGLIGVFDK